MNNQTTIRTRFPPSPTGDLHLGGARVALFNYLFAKHHGGEFILRMEDTDKERSSAASVQSILQGMEWLGLGYDEGPYYQSQRFDRYHEAITQLLAEGSAYRCYCSKERLDKLRAEQQANKQKPRYDGCCRNLDAEEQDKPYVVRFKTPLDGDVVFHDLVLGDICISNTELDDLIIARTDGSPTYHLTVVVDDWDMRISHVIRGVDHINNTPRQIHLLTALGAEVPVYAHLPMVLGADGKRLSKRHGAVDVMHYQQEGFLSQALLNQLVRLGWSHGDQEIFSLQEMIDLFTLEAVNSSDAVFDLEKLTWLNQYYMKSLPVVDVVPYLSQQFTALGIDCTKGPALEELLPLQAERSKTLKELAADSRYFYQGVLTYAPKAEKHLNADIVAPLSTVMEQLSALDTWQAEAIHAVINDVVAQYDIKFGKLAQPIRVAVTGDTRSPSIDVTLQLLGQSAVVARLRHAIGRIKA